MAFSGLQAVYFGAAPVMSFPKARRQLGLYLAWKIVQVAMSAVLIATVGRNDGALGVAVRSAIVWGLAVPSMTVLVMRGAGVRPADVVSAFLLP